MKRVLKYLTLLLFLGSCEDQINPELQDAPPVFVVDAFLTNQDSVQRIKISRSAPYFDNIELEGISGALVDVAVTNGTTINFLESAPGTYEWNPDGNGTFATVGDTLVLQITVQEAQFTATTTMNRVPDIDSISFRFEEENLFLPDSYFAEFWSRDLIGAGDTYWVKSYKNGVYLNQPDEINIAFDAGFSEGGNVDGLIFIPPIRDAINPFEQDENDDFLSPFEDGDSVYVEIHSISNEAFFFLNEVRIQTDRPGGFAELFATPLSNVRTNIQYLGNEDNIRVTGFFNAAAVTGAGKRLDVSTVPIVD